MKCININELAGIEYHGMAGISSESKNAILRLIHFGDDIHKATLLTNKGTHCFLLEINIDVLVAIKSGFSSGYRGTGAWALSTALLLLHRHDVEIDEYDVSSEIIDRIDHSALTCNDIESIKASSPVRPMRWYDYIFEEKLKDEKINIMLRHEFPETIPFGIIDNRLVDLALKFNANPDHAIMCAYRRLEDIVRKKSGIEGECSSKLFSKVFLGENPILMWEDINASEHKGRASLFTGTFMAFRNPRSHQEEGKNQHDTLKEFLLINHLYYLESQSVVQVYEEENK